LLAVGVCAVLASSSLEWTREAQAIIHASQHRTDCSRVQWVDTAHNSGIGSDVHVAMSALAFAMDHNAVMLWPRRIMWMSDSIVCPPSAAYEGYDCMFAPLSNCARNTLSAAKKLPLNIWAHGGSIPNVFRNFSVSPYPLLYWWHAQAALYFTRYNERLKHQLSVARERYFGTRTIPCGTVCVYVRHGSKASEMELLPWSRFENAIGTAMELIQLRAPACSAVAQKATQRAMALNYVYAIFDDLLVLADARASKLSSVLLHLADETIDVPPHERHITVGARPSHGPQNFTQNFLISMLNLEMCLQCDAFVSQRESNFARLIDELRATRVGKYGQPYIEVGMHSLLHYRW
jgi:hypothetical protein